MFIDYLADRMLVFDGKPGRSGNAAGPFALVEGMNRFLSDVKVTFRRDPDSHRPRVNKPGSVADRDQQQEKKYFYS
jgi:ATP-binding cassette subfamily E protein 1